MTVFPARRAFVPTSAGPAEPGFEPLVGARTGPMDWARRRRAERETRRVEAAGNRAVGQLAHLGPAWHVVDWPRTELPDTQWTDTNGQAGPERAGFLAIGPGGVFAVTVADHGRSRLLLAGDVVQISGRRPPWVTQARRDARRAGKALSAAIGQPVPVIPVLAFVGSGVVTTYGLPKDCLVATHRELVRLLVASGARISPATAEKLSAVARHPATWRNAPYRVAADYRWYADGQTAADKKAARR
jgi:hypothetical protein